jgi:hypothetical protein
MAFLISLSMSVNKKFRRESPIIYFLSVSIVVVYAVSCKAYGLIALAPPLIAIGFDGLTILSKPKASHWQNWPIAKHRALALKDVYRFVGQNWLLFTVTILVTSFTAITYVHHLRSIVDSPYAEKMISMVAEHSNTHGSLAERITIFFLNIIRNSVAFILYPYTTLLKPNALRPDDYILGFGPLTGILSDSRGVLNGSSIVRTTKADAAFGSILLVPFLVLLFITLLLQMTKKKVTLRRTARANGQNGDELINLFSLRSHCHNHP